MDHRIIKAISGIVTDLGVKNRVDSSALLGFDACIDNIVRVVKAKDDVTGTTFFESSNQFGEFLINNGNKSCGIELQTKLSKIGGNMVITGNALGNLGIKVECIGTFGLPEILPVFRTMSPNCSLHTVGETISATALEFNESKVIVFDPGPYNNLDWDDIKEQIGIEHLRTLFSGKQLISFLNWSEIEKSSDIWKSVLDEIIQDLIKSAGQKYFFTDFSDCSRKTKKEILNAITLLSRFGKYFKVILSLNQNEAELVAKALEISTDFPDDEFIRSLYKVVDSDIVVIHRTRDAIAFDGITLEKCHTFFCDKPTVLTGGGDNFNAGFCFALLHDFDLFQSLILANAVSGSYVKTGISPDVNALKDFLTLQMGNV